MAKMRLDKFLANAGMGTRTEIKQAIRKSLVTVNKRPPNGPEEKIDSEKDCVCFQGFPVSYEVFRYYMLHKPAGYISATEDARDRTVMELLKGVDLKGYFPVGRLDKDTEGLLLITNDGALAHSLLSPRKHVDKTYFVRVEGNVTEREAGLFREGVDIGDEKKTLPAELVIHRRGEISEVELTIREGRFHQVKRMFEAAGMRVLYLKRLSMGSLKLDEALGRGEARELTEEEVKELRGS